MPATIRLSRPPGAGAVVLAVAGSLDRASTEVLRRELSRVLANRDAALVVDLADATEVSAGALGLLFAIRRHARDIGIRFAVAGLGAAQVRPPLDGAAVVAGLEVQPSTAAALLAVSAAPRAASGADLAEAPEPAGPETISETGGEWRPPVQRPRSDSDAGPASEEPPASNGLPGVSGA